MSSLLVKKATKLKMSFLFLKFFSPLLMISKPFHSFIFAPRLSCKSKQNYWFLQFGVPVTLSVIMWTLNLIFVWIFDRFHILLSLSLWNICNKKTTEIQMPFINLCRGAVSNLEYFHTIALNNAYGFQLFQSIKSNAFKRI